ncbi:unnamed protein product, partial [Meganyctiphanes norvegica]
MDDFAQVYLASPPSSLPDGLHSPHESGTPIPRPRRSSSLTLTSPTLSLTSTPKHPITINHRHLPPTPLTNGHDQHRPPGRGVLSNGSMQRAPSLDSATDRVIPLSPIAHLMTNYHSDSETEEDNSSPLSIRRGSNSRPGNHSGRSVRRSKHQQHSYSLPATPRVNGGSPFAHTINGIQPLATSYTALSNSSAMLGFPYGSSSHLGMGFDYSHQDNVSPGVSQYITCHNISDGRLDGTFENSLFLRNHSKLPGAIDYSSLPLPEGSNGGSNGSGRRNKRDNISRHCSEPCIPQSGKKSSYGYSVLSNRKSRNRNSKEVLSRDREMGDINETLNGKSNGLEYGSAPVGGELNTLEVQWRFIQTLVTELNTTKSTNRKLLTELHQAKMEIQVLKASLDSYTESGVQPGAITEMVGAIHAAQKVRDESMMARIKLANEERDSALTHTRGLMEKLSLNPHLTTDHKLLPGDSLEQDVSIGSSSMIDSPRRSADRRHKRSQEPVLSSAASTASYTGSSNSQGRGLGEQHHQRGSQQGPGESEGGPTVAHLAGLEEELKALRLATVAHTPGSNTG